jgi:hypothetical protein
LGEWLGGIQYTQYAVRKLFRRERLSKKMNASWVHAIEAANFRSNLARNEKHSQIRLKIPHLECEIATIPVRQRDVYNQ